MACGKPECQMSRHRSRSTQDANPIPAFGHAIEVADDLPAQGPNVADVLPSNASSDPVNSPTRFPDEALFGGPCRI
jgi:hypothetical protein